MREICGRRSKDLHPIRRFQRYVGPVFETTDPGEAQQNKRETQLYIFCLGPLRVFRDGKYITETEWGQTKGPTQKVKALFAYLLAKGSRGATKDAIMELLWGGKPINDKVEVRLHAALYYLRRALEPGLPPRT